MPLAFVGSMVLGGAAQWAGVNVPQVEALIAVSGLVLGLLVATATKLPTWAAMVVGLFAISHGAAHAAESAGSSALGYATGFVFATIALHAAGGCLGVAATGVKSPRLPRLAGVAIAACVALIVTGVL